jgi:hypothetical protein
MIRAPISFELPIRTVSEMNRRDHWSRRAKRMREHRLVTAMATVPRLLDSSWWNSLASVSCTVTRIGPRMLDQDNLAGSIKGVIDGIADALGVQDNDPRIVWRYAQLKRTRSRATATLPAYAIRIEIEAA